MLSLVCVDLFLSGLVYPHPPVGFLSINFGLDYLFDNFHRQRRLYVKLLLEVSISMSVVTPDKRENRNIRDKHK